MPVVSIWFIDQLVWSNVLCVICIDLLARISWTTIANPFLWMINKLLLFIFHNICFIIIIWYLYFEYMFIVIIVSIIMSIAIIFMQLLSNTRTFCKSTSTLEIWSWRHIIPPRLGSHMRSRIPGGGQCPPSVIPWLATQLYHRVF